MEFSTKDIINNYSRNIFILTIKCERGTPTLSGETFFNAAGEDLIDFAVERKMRRSGERERDSV